MTKTGRQSTRHHEMHTQEHALKKKTPIYDFFPVGESRLYWYRFVKIENVGLFSEMIDNYYRWHTMKHQTFGHVDGGHDAGEHVNSLLMKELQFF